MNDIVKVCPYCGNEYGASLQCCGETDAHAVFVLACDDTCREYATYEEAQKALEQA